MNAKRILILASFLGAFAVILGAFGAHALKELLSEDQLNSYQTGNTYHFYHALLLLIIGILYKLRRSNLLRMAAWFCVVGILCFSGSIYLLSCKDVIGISNTSWLGPITPIGGLLFIVSWSLIAINFMKKDINER